MSEFKWCEQCNLPADICRGHYTEKPLSGCYVYPHVVGDNAMRAPSVDVTALAAQIATLPVQTLVELAAALVATDATQADRLIDAISDAQNPVVDAERHERIAKVVYGGRAEPVLFANLEDWSALGDDDFDEYSYLPLAQ